MENNKEKKTITISLKTFVWIMVMILIVILGIVGLYASRLMEKNKEKQVLEKHEVEVNVDEKAKELFEKGAYEIRKLIYGSNEYELAEPKETKEINGVEYIKTTEKYKTVEEKYGEIFTGKALENVLSMQFINIDGILYRLNAWGATGWDITNVEVEKINEENGELTYIATYNDVSVTGDIREEKYTSEFKIKEFNGEYKISAINYCDIDEVKQSPNNTTDNNIDDETAETVSNKDKMLDMLKHRSSGYMAKYYYRLADLRDNKNGTYTATVDFYSPVYITEEKYNNMVDTGSIELNGDSYKFAKLEDQGEEVYGDVIDEGYGYITSNDKLSYCVEKQGDKYAFYREIGGVKTIINNKDDSFEIILGEDTTVNVMFNEPEDGYNKLKDYASELKRNIIYNWTITFEYSEEDEEICIGVDPR